MLDALPVTSVEKIIATVSSFTWRPYAASEQPVRAASSWQTVATSTNMRFGCRCASTVARTQVRGLRRWWIYQRERFPLAAHGPLIAAFSASAVSFSALLRGGEDGPRVASFVVAFVVSLGSFLQLRIADEFKDAEEDARYRPYRPVPRGLVKLSELAAIGVVIGAVQLVGALWLGCRGR